MIGQRFRQGQFGRLWAPMIEVLGSRELSDDATTHWDLAPQLHVTLNTRQHVRANVGVRVPVNNRRGAVHAVPQLLPVGVVRGLAVRPVGDDPIQQST